jgi:hypothetical protein
VAGGKRHMPSSGACQIGEAPVVADDPVFATAQASFGPGQTQVANSH